MQKKDVGKTGLQSIFLLQQSVLCGSRCLWFLSELAAEQSCGQPLCEGMCVKKCGIFGAVLQWDFLDFGRGKSLFLVILGARGHLLEPRGSISKIFGFVVILGALRHEKVVPF